MCHESVFAILHCRRDELKYEARPVNMIIATRRARFTAIEVVEDL